MHSILSFVKDIPVLLQTYISPQLFNDIRQLIVIKSKRITKSFPIEVHITEHCNLNCKGCSHFSCIADEEYLDPLCFENDMRRLSELSKKYFTIKILGGEPLLHPRITEFFEIARAYFPTTPIQVTTNGLLLTRQSEAFWQSCYRNAITVSISQYPVTLDKKEIKKIAKNMGVTIVYTGSTAQKRMCKMPLDISGSQNSGKSYAKCAISWGCCVTLREGRLYTCCTAAHIKFFNRYFKQNLVISEKDYVDIYRINSIEDVISFLEKPFPFCRYCKTQDTRFAQSWGITKKEISEWVD